MFALTKEVDTMSKVLIVDDSSIMRMTLKRIVEKMGASSVREATNGNEAVSIYSRYKPDLVIMDITMPEKDGVNALKDIMALNRNAKIIMCSTNGQKKMVIDSIMAGAKDFILKPFHEDKVKDVVGKLLKV